MVKEIEVASFTNGIIGPSVNMLGPISGGGTIIAYTAPGCWGPMITPSLIGGHEVTEPVAVEGADVGDGIVVEIKCIEVTSQATASGVHKVIDGRFVGDPSVAAECPK